MNMLFVQGRDFRISALVGLELRDKSHRLQAILNPFPEFLEILGPERSVQGFRVRGVRQCRPLNPKLNLSGFNVEIPIAFLTRERSL